MAEAKRTRKTVVKQTMVDTSDDDDDDDETSGKGLSRAVKSKLAAKSRRDQETVELASLCQELPFPGSALDKLDKSSLIRLAITYIHMKTYIKKDMKDRVYKEPVRHAVAGVTPVSQKSLIAPVPGGGMVTCWNSHNNYHHQPQPLIQQHPHQQQQQPQKEIVPVQQQIVQHHQDVEEGRLMQHQDVEDGRLMLEQNVEEGHLMQHQDVEEGRLMLESLQGFLIFINKKGKVMYISDTVEQHLGLKQETLLGSPVMDVVHPGDVKELGKQFTIRLQKSSPGDPTKTNDPVSTSSRNLLHSDQKRTFYLRMRFVVTKDGSKTRHSGYTLVQWNGRLKLRVSSKPSGYGIDGLLCICRPVQSHSILEIRLGGNMFMSRHDLSMKFTFCDPRILTLIGYEPCEVIGKTAYYFHNPLDVPKISDCHSNLIIKGTSVSKYYRFFGKNGDWVWMQTRATIISNTANRPQYVVCMNYVIGEDEGQRYLMMEEEQQGFRDPNVRGCIDLTNTSTESPVSTCSSGDDSHDDTGYSSGYSHCTEANSPPTTGSGNLSSPDIHTVESTDDGDSVLDDYPMVDDSQTEILQKEISDPVDQTVTAMSNGFDPFLSSFREELGFSEPTPGNGMDLLDDLLKTMEDEQQMCPPPQPSTVVLNKTQTTTSLQTGHRQSLLRSLLDRGDSMPNKSLKDYQYSSVAPGPGFASVTTGMSKQSATSTNSKSSLPYTSFKSQAQTDVQAVTKSQSSVGKQLENPVDASQPDPFIPEDLLDFAMQYCESIAEDQSQGILPISYDQDPWSNTSMDDLITTLADSLTSTTPVQSTPQHTTTVGSQELSYLDLDKVNSINKEHHYSCRTQSPCRGTQIHSNSMNGFPNQTIHSTFATASPSRSVSSKSSEGVFTQHLKASNRATATQTAHNKTFVNGPFTSPTTQKCCKSSAARTGHNRSPKSACTVVNSGAPVKSVSFGYKGSRNAKSILQSMSGGAVCSRASTSTMSTSTMSSRFTGPTATTATTPRKQTAPQYLQGMSELEKYLRGYVKEPVPPQPLTLSQVSSMSSGPTPFLQKLLTGEISRELYREIDSQMVRKEKERRSSTSSLSDASG